MKPYTDEKLNKIGHLYSVLDDAGNSNEILNGSLKGTTFAQYFQDNKQKFGLQKYEQFPLVIALVEAADDLSLQVHPDDDIAFSLEQRPYGKNESWYFIETLPNQKIYNGCLCHTWEEIQEKIKNKESDKIADKLAVKPGDYVYVESGTMHALSRGSFVYEIEENCELTYRIYDFDRVDAQGRSRELHLDKAAKAIHVNKKSQIKKYDDFTQIEERMYVTQLLKNKKGYQNTSNTLECITVLEGTLPIEGVLVQTGMSLILEPFDSIEYELKQAILARPKNEGVE